MFWIQAGCPRLNPEFLADPQPVDDLGHLIGDAYPLLAEDVIVSINHQLYRLAYQDFNVWIDELVPFLNEIWQGRDSQTALHDQSSFDSEWTVQVQGERLQVGVRWDPFAEGQIVNFVVNRGHFLREWKEALMRLRLDLAPFAHLLMHREDWDALVAWTDAIEGRGSRYGGIPEWELPEA